MFLSCFFCSKAFLVVIFLFSLTATFQETFQRTGFEGALLSQSFGHLGETCMFERGGPSQRL